MSDNGPVTMRATFYGGPADGGEVLLAEPIRQCLRFPLSPLEAVDLFETLPADRERGQLIPNNVAAHYVLDMVPGGLPRRDAAGRVCYRYRVPNPAPKEETHD